MDFLRDESVKMRNKIYWCYRSKLPNKIIQDLILKKNGFFIKINGFDSFMADIGSKLYSTEITPPETENILLQRCNSRIEQYNKRWSELHSYSKQVKELKNLELALEMRREESKTLTYYDYFRRGTECREKKHFERAIEYYDKSIELNGGFTPTYNDRGVSYFYLKQYEKSIEDYNKAIELNPNYLYAYYNRGCSYSSLKQYDKAIEDYIKAIELNPALKEAYIRRAMVYRLLDRPDLAELGEAKAKKLDK